MYLKYEKTLYPLNNEQMKIIQSQMAKGGKVVIGNEALLTYKCEIVENAANKDEYEIKYTIINQQIGGDEYYTQISREHATNMKRWLAQTPEQKAERSWECMGKTKYMLRNGFQQPNPQRIELIKKKMIAYFQENDMAWCPESVYESLLPPKKEIVNVGGWSRVGDLVASNTLPA